MTAIKPYFDDGQVSLYVGDCLDVLAGLPDGSVDAVVTDPPYNLSGSSEVHRYNTPNNPENNCCARETVRR